MKIMIFVTISIEIELIYEKKIYHIKHEYRDECRFGIFVCVYASISSGEIIDR